MATHSFRWLARRLRPAGEGAAGFVRRIAGTRTTFPGLLKLCGGALGIALLVLFFWPVATTFIVVAETEVVRADSASGSSFAWRLAGATLCAGPPPPRRPGTAAGAPPLCAGAPAAFEEFDGYLDLRSAVRARIERLATGPLEIGLTEAGEPFRVRARVAGPAGETLWLEPPVSVTMRQPTLQAGRGVPVTLPLPSTAVVVGREPALEAVGPQPILRSGAMALLGRTLVGERTYVAQRVVLEQGDTVSVDDPLGAFSLLVRVDERPALQSLFRVRAYRVAVTGFFSDPRHEQLSFFDKVLNDRLFTTVASLFGLIVAALASLRGSPGP